MWDKYRNKKNEANKGGFSSSTTTVVAQNQNSTTSSTNYGTYSDASNIAEIKKTVGTFPTKILRRQNEKIELHEIKVTGEGKIYNVELLFWVYQSNHVYEDDDAGEFYDDYMAVVWGAEHDADNRLYNLKLQRHLYVNVEAKVDKTIYV